MTRLLVYRSMFIPYDEGTNFLLSIRYRGFQAGKIYELDLYDNTF